MAHRPKDWSPATLLADELMQEKASALGRLGRGLEAALAALAAFDPAAAPEARAVLVDTAAYALWMLMVQREACGLRDSRALMRDYNVPAEVQRRVGIATRPPLAPARAGRPRSR